MSDNDHLLKIGDTFTPLEWGMFAIERFGVFDRWLSGASIFDPTMGKGDLLEALLRYGIKQGYTVRQLPVDRLFGNELNQLHYEAALAKFEQEYGLDMKGNCWNEDIFRLEARSFDIILGNPPWQNFVDLPASYKERLKQVFEEYDLVDDRQKLLLGGSRMDIAALVIQCCMKKFVKQNGWAYFFLPLSLFLNDGANERFRTYQVQGVSFAPRKLYDFHSLSIFPSVLTRYGLCAFERDQEVSFPIPFFRYEEDDWQEYEAQPLFHPQNALSILPPNQLAQQHPLHHFQAIEIQAASQPRQGINTCGANKLFFFTDYEELDDGLCLLNGEIRLPSRFVFPLLTRSNFQDELGEAKKWVLLPYNTNGKPLKWTEIEAYPHLVAYLTKHQKSLVNRKGRMIQSSVKRGRWWAMLGVGAYNYMPFKVVWEAYGKREFRPMIVEGNWQVNQSLQAYMPARNREEAERILAGLMQPAVEAYLLSLKMEGTMNWAQPGRIKRLLKLVE